MDFDENNFDISNIVDNPEFTKFAVSILRHNTTKILEPGHCYLMFKTKEDLDFYKECYKNNDISDYDFGEDIVKILRNNEDGIVGLKWHDQEIRTYNGTFINSDDLNANFVITPFEKIINIEEEEFYEILEINPRQFNREGKLFFDVFISKVEQVLWDIMNINNPDII